MEHLPAVSLIIFFSVFLAVIVKLVFFTSKEQVDNWARLPLEKGPLEKGPLEKGPLEKTVGNQDAGVETDVR